MWVRKLAWLHAKPEKSEKTRIEALAEAEKETQLTPPDWGDNIIDALIEIGLGEPISFTEIQAWAAATNTYLPGFEALLINKMSREYCNQYQKSNNKNCSSPDLDEATMKTVAADGMRDLIKKFKGL